MAAAPPQSSYITDAWNTLPKYVCPGCGYDTLRTAQIEAHQQHCAAFRAMTTVATTADPAGPHPPDEPVPEPDPVPVPDEPDDEPHPAPEA